MNTDIKTRLKSTLIAGTINVEEFEAIKREIFLACKMDIRNACDRMKWSNWISGKSIPERTFKYPDLDYKTEINQVLMNHNLPAIYDEATND